MACLDSFLFGTAFWLYSTILYVCIFTYGHWSRQSSILVPRVEGMNSVPRNLTTTITTRLQRRGVVLWVIDIGNVAAFVVCWSLILLGSPGLSASLHFSLPSSISSCDTITCRLLSR